MFLLQVMKSGSLSVKLVRRAAQMNFNIQSLNNSENKSGWEAVCAMRRSVSAYFFMCHRKAGQESWLFPFPCGSRSRKKIKTVGCTRLTWTRWRSGGLQVDRIAQFSDWNFPNRFKSQVGQQKRTHTSLYPYYILTWIKSVHVSFLFVEMVILSCTRINLKAFVIAFNSHFSHSPFLHSVPGSSMCSNSCQRCGSAFQLRLRVSAPRTGIPRANTKQIMPIEEKSVQVTILIRLNRYNNGNQFYKITYHAFKNKKQHIPFNADKDSLLMLQVQATLRRAMRATTEVSEKAAYVPRGAHIEL